MAYRRSILTRISRLWHPSLSYISQSTTSRLHQTGYRGISSSFLLRQQDSSTSFTSLSGSNCLLQKMDYLEETTQFLSENDVKNLDSSVSIVSDNPTLALAWAKIAMDMLHKTDKTFTLLYCKNLCVIASSLLCLKKDSEQSITQLNRAVKHLATTEEKRHAQSDDCKAVMYNVQYLYAQVKIALGHTSESLIYLKNMFEMKKSISSSPFELSGDAKMLAEQCFSCLMFDDALSYCLVAIDSCQVPIEIAHDRYLLADIYMKLDKSEKALHEIQQASEIYRKLGSHIDLTRAQIKMARIYMSLEKFGDATDLLKNVLQKVDEATELRAMAFVAMAKNQSLFHENKNSDSRSYLKSSCEILENEELEISREGVDAYMEICALYESLDDNETAIKLLKRTLYILENFPQEQYLEASASFSLGRLLLITGNVSDSVVYLERGANLMIKSLGSKHAKVGYCFLYFASAYEKLSRPIAASQMLNISREILGPEVADPIFEGYL